MCGILFMFMLRYYLRLWEGRDKSFVSSPPGLSYRAETNPPPSVRLHTICTNQDNIPPTRCSTNSWETLNKSTI